MGNEVRPCQCILKKKIFIDYSNFTHDDAGKIERKESDKRIELCKDNNQYIWGNRINKRKKAYSQNNKLKHNKFLVAAIKKEPILVTTILNLATDPSLHYFHSP